MCSGQSACESVCTTRLRGLCFIQSYNYRHKTILLTGQTYVCKLQPSLLHSIRITNSNSAFHLIQSTNSSLAGCCCRVLRARSRRNVHPSFAFFSRTYTYYEHKNWLLHHPVAVYDQSLDLTKLTLQVQKACIFILAIGIAQAMKFSFVRFSLLSIFLFFFFIFNNENGTRTKSESFSEWGQ